MVSELGAIQHQSGKEEFLVFIIPFGQMCPNIWPQLRLYKDASNATAGYRSNKMQNLSRKFQSPFCLAHPSYCHITTSAVHHTGSGAHRTEVVEVHFGPGMGGSL
jgi:hypothetical protein